MSGRGQPAPLFIGGTGRCGTTALGKAFGRHLEVAKLPRKPRIVTDPGGILDLVESTSSKWGPFRADRALYEFEYIWNELRSDTNGRYQGHKMERWIGEEKWEELIENLKDDFIHHKSSGKWLGSPPGRNEIYEVEHRHHMDVQQSARQFMQELFEHLNWNARFWVDDTPYSVQHLKELWRIFPGMKMIHIHRHPLEVLYSYQKIRRGNYMWVSDDVVANARRIRGIYEGWIQQLHTTMDAQEVARDVKLQDLVDEPVNMLGKMCEFVGIEYQSEMAEEINSDEVSNIRFIPSEDKDEVYEILEPVAEWYGYEL